MWNFINMSCISIYQQDIQNICQLSSVEEPAGWPVEWDVYSHASEYPAAHNPSYS